MTIFLSIIFRSLAAVCAKEAGTSSAGRPLSSVILNPWFVAEIAFLFLQALTWTQVLRRHSLHFAYPFMSLVVGLNLGISYFLFAETLRVQHLAGAAVIIVGVWLAARNAGDI